MIILKHLTIERFRLLREINLHFPQRGSILIQGQNEAGKSALVESIYFALYGEPLALSAKSRLDDLILYGASTASVTLTLSIGATEMTVTRTLERGKGQKVLLLVRKLGMPEERPITSLSAANERIIAELGRMDGAALRDSCLVEQKGLARLEQLPGSQRENSLRKLLGLEKLMRVTERFKVTPHDDLLLEERRERLKLAQLQARIPELSAQLGEREAALDAVSVLDELAEIDLQEVEAFEEHQSLKYIDSTRNELKARQSRVHILRKADATLGEIIAAYDAMAEARRVLPELEQQIAELERHEREELPALERRVTELADLMRTFGTLERMSNDLLSSINRVKELEQEAKENETLQSSIDVLEEQIITARLQVEQLRQELSELEEHRRTGRPVLEERLRRLQGLAGRLDDLRKAEERLAQQSVRREQAGENSKQLAKVQQDIQVAEKERAQAEAEVQRAQQQIEALELRLRQLRVRSLLEEWLRLNGLAQELADAEQKVMAVHQQQEQLTLATMAARRTVTTWQIALIACAAVVVLGFGGATVEVLQHAFVIAVLALVLALGGAGAAYWCWQKYSKASQEERIVKQQMQAIMNQVSAMVAERSAAMRQGANKDALIRVEQELRSLGSTIPRSRDEANYYLQQQQAGAQFIAPEAAAGLQKQLAEQRDSLTAARTRANAQSSALAALQQEYTRLGEQRKQEGWDNIEGRLRAEQAAIEQKRRELISRIGEEGLPIPHQANVGAQLRAPAGDTQLGTQHVGAQLIAPANANTELETLLKDTIGATELEIAILDGKQDEAADLATQITAAQEKLDDLLAREQTLIERREYFQAQDPQQQIARAREQQKALRDGLHVLQDSLRERVKPLGVAFGQTAVSNAEVAARKQLEELHIRLGSRMELESRRVHYVELLKDRQESLSEYYQQLARFSGSLGGWIVPPNPFAEALATLRTRCQRELQEANESGIQQELERLKLQESASKAKIELCRQEIEEAKERITTLLTQHSRPAPKSFNHADIVVVWPLLGQYTITERERLEAELDTMTQELHQLEQQELALSEQLQTGRERLDLKQTQQRLDQQEHSYQTKKYGNQLVQAVNERLMRKMVPHTEYYMQHILPLLTGGRYHDVKLSTEPEEGAISGGPFQLRVWDAGAGEYVPKSALSGGAADQLSLALRLAFAIAALPRELSAAPGFLLLDEPLSSFDRGRAKALVDVVTGDLLGQHFEQVLFISHSGAFDPAMFPYHIYLDNGLVVESNLPIVNSLPLPTIESNGHGDDDSEATMKVAVPASMVVEG